MHIPISRREALKLMGASAVALTAPPWSIGEPAPVAALAQVYPFSLNPLPYAADALGMFIDSQTMQLHHGKHHAAYVNNLNKALEIHPDLHSRTLGWLITHLDQLPDAIRTTVRNNGGGHANHDLFWNVLSAQPGLAPDEKLATAIDAAFGSLDACLEALRKAAMSVFGSGWAWLSRDGDELKVETTPNQDSPVMHGRTPIIGIDVWEHAYYLRYQNRRADYVTALLNHIDWPKAGMIAA